MIELTSRLALAAAFFVGGCGGNHPAESADSAAGHASPLTSVGGGPESPGTEVASPSPAAAAPTTPAIPASAPPLVATAEATPALTDAQILRVLHSANTSEIAQAKLAVARGRDVRVRKLAALMLDARSNADKKAAALAKKAGLTPEPSFVSAALESDTDQNTRSLEADSGDDFDAAYVGSQIKQHRAELSLIDGKLIPNARASDLVTLLATVRPTVELHLQRSMDLQSAMQK